MQCKAPDGRKMYKISHACIAAICSEVQVPTGTKKQQESMSYDPWDRWWVTRADDSDNPTGPDVGPALNPWTPEWWQQQQQYAWHRGGWEPHLRKAVAVHLSRIRHLQGRVESYPHLPATRTRWQDILGSNHSTWIALCPESWEWRSYLHPRGREWWYYNELDRMGRMELLV